MSWLNLQLLPRTYRDPIAILILLVDLFPIFAIWKFGWGAAPLVFLYWLENLVVGGFALARMVATSVKESVVGIGVMAFIGPFFFFHYGMFCFVHGQFLRGFALSDSNDFVGPLGLVNDALSSGENLQWFFLAIIALQGLIFVKDFLLDGQYKYTSVNAEMAAPYGRVVVLHVALFAGAFALAALGEPLWGVLSLIVLRAIWGAVFTVRRRLRLDGKLG